MMERTHLVVFGATGFTAQRVISELVARGTTWIPAGFTWALGGRNLKNLETQAGKLANIDGIPKPSVVYGDVTSPESMLRLAQSTKLVLNCVGPYRDTGEPVVKACVQGGADYLDLCGEPEFIEKMVLNYFEAARKAGVSIVHAAAYDSVPCDFAVLAAKRAIQARGAAPGSIEMFMAVHNDKLSPGGHYATYQAAVDGFSSAYRELPRVRKHLSQSMWSARPAPLRPLGPVVRLRRGTMGVSTDERVGGYMIPYFFSDPAVVRLSQSLDSYLGTRTPNAHFTAYLVIARTWTLIILTFYYTIFSSLVQSPFGRSLLLAYPSLFTKGAITHTGPTQAQLDDTRFSQTYIIKGYYKPSSPSSSPTRSVASPDVNLRATMTGPEPGYVATPIFFLLCAREILRNRERVTRGVLTPAVAFTHGVEEMLQQLNEDGRVQWQIDEEKEEVSKR
ncbi:Saccharopine dehydrogenase-domain-containing protein [Auriculariales sp. MPI-PUGE-AT-0066]|nr:Saccharopine dehydrogenase-domain-containing protein [Auriculariales sp. MPI-PUGE-AT-0066]